MRKFVVPAIALAGVLATAGAFAQDARPQQGGMAQTMPCCGTGTPAQGAPMQGMTMQG